MSQARVCDLSNVFRYIVRDRFGLMRMPHPTHLHGSRADATLDQLSFRFHLCFFFALISISVQSNPFWSTSTSLRFHFDAIFVTTAISLRFQIRILFFFTFAIAPMSFRFELQIHPRWTMTPHPRPCSQDMTKITRQHAQTI